MPLNSVKMNVKITLWLIPLLVVCDASQMVSRVGNRIKASISGVDVAGATFLQRDIVLDEGVVFAYSAYFRSNKPVRLQIWRPTENGTVAGTTISLTLVAETRVMPSVILGREDIYIESRLTEKCIRVEQDDRLGVMLEESPGAVSYVFDDASPTALGNRLQNASEPYEINDVVLFDALIFPYDFSVAAYVDVDPSHYAAASGDDFVDCYPLVTIPTEDELDQVTTTLAPPTGAQGATGATGPRGPWGLQGPAGLPGPIGSSGAIGATGAAGATGQAGNDGVPGATGAQGPAGANGDRGSRGEAGAQGPAGETVYVTGSPGSAGGSVNEGNAFYSTTEMSLGYLIWLILLSIIVIILFIILFIVVRRRRKSPALDNSFDPYVAKKFPSNSNLDTVNKSSGHWNDYPKDDTEAVYTLRTLERDPTKSNEQMVEIPMEETIGQQTNDKSDFAHGNESKPDYMY